MYKYLAVSCGLLCASVASGFALVSAHDLFSSPVVLVPPSVAVMTPTPQRIDQSPQSFQPVRPYPAHDFAPHPKIVPPARLTAVPREHDIAALPVRQPQKSRTVLTASAAPQYSLRPQMRPKVTVHLARPIRPQTAPPKLRTPQVVQQPRQVQTTKPHTRTVRRYALMDALPWWVPISGKAQTVAKGTAEPDYYIGVFR